MLPSDDSRTLALLVQKVDTLTDYLREKMDSYEKRMDGYERRLHDLEAAHVTTNTAVVRLAERLSSWQMVQGAYASILAAIAAWWGGRP